MEQEIFKNSQELSNYINKIENVFNAEKILRTKINKTKIQKYYHDSNIGYNLVHSKEGAVHMALNYDGVFNENGYYQQVKEISKYINENDNKKILELGCGKGFNSFYLAKKFDKSNFYGIDISNKHLSIAKKKAKEIKNLTFTYGDFHSIEYDDSIFDIVFELESICHSNNPKVVLSEVHRVLKPNGLFIIYEGFRTKNYDNLTDLQRKAAVLIEKSMAVNRGYRIDEWLNIAKEVGFSIEQNDNISQAIMPNLIRFHKLAKKYYKYTFLSKLLLKLLPDDLIKNTIAGLLMPFSVYQGIQSYNRIILRKK